ncbi:hypothetical protein KDA23_07110 [Candidatus Saccharibacteria bacterium]|nr:hypothetical protein [Candidatus Saccharibacteria bacterium]
MKVISFPNWFELKTVNYIADFFNGENKVELGENSFIFDHEIPRDYLTSPDLEHIWSKAKKRNSGDPSEGQIELFRMIEFSFPETDANWTTTLKAEQWRKRFLATLDKLEVLWDEMPSNFMTHVDDSQNMFRADELYKHGTGIREFKSGIEQLECVEPLYGRQTVGRKAEKLHFMKELSGEFQLAMGKWMRIDVAKITSVIYGVSVTAQDVAKATRGMEKPIQDNKFKTLLPSNKT